MGRKLKYNINESRWELLAEDGSVISYAVGSVNANPWDLTGDNAWKQPNEVTITAGGTVDATAVSADIVAGATAYARGRKITGTLAEAVVVEGDTTTTISPGYLKRTVVVNTADIPTGYADVSVVTATAADVLSTVTFVDSHGVPQSGSISTVTPKRDGNTFSVAKGYVAVAYTDAVPTANEPTVSDNVVTLYEGYQTPDTITVGEALSATSYTPGVQDQTIPAGKYITGVQTIKGDTNLVSSNIAKDVTIFGITGTHEGGSVIPDGYADVSVVTATAADVLSTVTFVDSRGVPQSGSIQEAAAPTVNGNKVTVHKGYIKQDQTVTVDTVDPAELNLIDTSAVLENYTFAGRTEGGSIGIFYGSLENKGELIVTPNSDTQTFDGGYYMAISVNPAPKTGSEFTVNGDLTSPLSYISEYASLDGTPGSLIDKRFSTDERIGTITSLSPLMVAEGGDMIIGGNNYVEVDSTNITSENIKDGVTILGVEGTYVGEGTGDSTAIYGYLDDSGKFQALDLTADTPADSGTAEDFTELVMYKTGRDEPGYTSEGGGSGSSVEFYECTNAEASSYFDLSGASDNTFNGRYYKRFDRYYDDSVDYTYTFYKWVNEKGCELREGGQWSPGGGYGEYHLYAPEATTFTYAIDAPFSAPYDTVDFSTYRWVTSDFETYVPITCTKTTTEDTPSTWSGYKMVWSEDEAGWIKTGEPVDGLEVKGYTPVAGKVYSADSTINGNMYPEEIPTGGSNVSAPDLSSPNTIPVLLVDGEVWVAFNAKYGDTRRGLDAPGNTWSLEKNDGKWGIYSLGSDFWGYWGGSADDDPWNGSWTATADMELGDVTVEMKVTVVE